MLSNIIKHIEEYKKQRQQLEARAALLDGAVQALELLLKEESEDVQDD